MATDLNMIIAEARALYDRADRASMYPANELILIARLIEQLARAIQERWWVV